MGNKEEGETGGFWTLSGDVMSSLINEIACLSSNLSVPYARFLNSWKYGHRYTINPGS